MDCSAWPISLIHRDPGPQPLGGQHQATCMISSLNLLSPSGRVSCITNVKREHGKMKELAQAHQPEIHPDT